jgi:hypothetical protein
VKNIAKFIIELKEIFINENLIQVFKNNKLDKDIKSFTNNLKNISNKFHNIVRDDIEFFLVQMECMNDFLERGSTKILTRQMSMKPIIRRGSIRIPRTSSTQNFIINPINFSIINTTEKRNKNTIQSEYSDLFDEYAILSIIEHSTYDPYKLKKIITWRKKIIEIAKNNGLLVAKILSTNTIRKLEIDDFDIIEVEFINLGKFDLY